jgi:hypothetical protein
MDVVKDLCDEIFRRHENKDPFLLVRTDFAPKRNQARQKMATLGEDKIKEFAFDLLHELEKRFPFVLDYLKARGRSKSNEDIRKPQRRTPPSDRAAPPPPPLQGNHEHPEELTNMIDDFKQSMIQKQARERKTLETKLMKLEYDHEQLTKRYQDEQNLVQELRLKVQTLEQMMEKKDLVSQHHERDMKDLKSENVSLKDRIGELEKQNQILQEQRKNATVRLGSRNRISNLSDAPTRISRLQSVRPSLRFSEAPTRMSKFQSKLLSPSEVSPPNEFGDWIVEELDFLGQQLIDCAKSHQSQSLLEPLRDIIVVTKMIAEECDNKEVDPTITESDKDLLFDMNYKISAALKLLVEASRNYVSNGTDRQLDKTNRHLNEMVGLIQEFFKVYNTMGLTPAPSAPIDFQQVLQEEVDEIALSIQDLLGVLKESEPDRDLITDLVNHLVKHVDFAIIECSNNTPPSNSTEEVLEELAKARDALLDQYDDYMVRPVSVKPLANAAYDIAKTSQDLLYALNSSD